MNGLGARRLRGEVWGCVSVPVRLSVGPRKRVEVATTTPTRAFPAHRGVFLLFHPGLRWGAAPRSAAGLRETHRRYLEHHRGLAKRFRPCPFMVVMVGGGQGHGQGRHGPEKRQRLPSAAPASTFRVPHLWLE